MNYGLSDTQMKLIKSSVLTSKLFEASEEDYEEQFTGAKPENEPSIDDNDLASLKFAEEIKILLIQITDFRLLCHFMGLGGVKDIQNAVYKHVTIIGNLVQESLPHYFAGKGYAFSGEINFDNNGNVIPCVKQTWTIKDKDINFTTGGYLFFEKINGKSKRENVAVYCFVEPNSGLSGFTLYSDKVEKGKKFLKEIEEFTKKNNCFRGAKIRDVNMNSGTFSEVKATERHNWENFYFPKHVREMFDLEVFGFLASADRYNKLGITKRGLLMHGAPGTGKSTIGNIICNEAKGSTVILITPELIAENSINGKQSIKLLYMLADFVSPAVIFLEDLDLFAEDRDNSQGDVALGGLMNVLDGVNQVRNAVTVATTNRLELIEKALSNRPGRFDRVVEIPALEDGLRRRMFTDRLQECKIDDGVIDRIIKISDGWTGAECQEFINSMNLLFINKNQDAKRHITMEVVNEVNRIIGRLSTTVKKKTKVGFNSGDDDE